MSEGWEFAADPAAAERRRDAARLAAEDLRETARTPAGRRTLLRLLERLGAQVAPGPDPAACALHAAAEELLETLGTADPALCLSLIAALRGFPLCGATPATPQQEH